MGDVFYRNEISGDLLMGDELFESFSTVANWDGPEYDWDFSGDLIEDPVGKHGESLQSELELTAGHMEVYLNALQRAVKKRFMRSL